MTPPSLQAFPQGVDEAVIPRAVAADRALRPRPVRVAAGDALTGRASSPDIYGAARSLCCRPPTVAVLGEGRKGRSRFGGARISTHRFPARTQRGEQQTSTTKFIGKAKTGPLDAGMLWTRATSGDKRPSAGRNVFVPPAPESRPYRWISEQPTGRPASNFDAISVRESKLNVEPHIQPQQQQRVVRVAVDVPGE